MSRTANIEELVEILESVGVDITGDGKANGELVVIGQMSLSEFEGLLKEKGLQLVDDNTTETVCPLTFPKEAVLEIMKETNLKIIKDSDTATKEAQLKAGLKNLTEKVKEGKEQLSTGVKVIGNVASEPLKNMWGRIKGNRENQQNNQDNQEKPKDSAPGV